MSRQHPCWGIIALLGVLLLAACSGETMALTATPAASTEASAPTATKPAPAATNPPTTPAAPVAVSPGKPAQPELILATTTSTQDSGLLDVLIPDFQARTGYHVKPVAVGSGQALQMGQQGNADVLLVHSPDAELAFMQTGAGVDRRLVMHNDFVIIGPTADPANARARKAVPALDAIAAVAAPFVSRGDNSGTNALELKLWKEAKIDPTGKPWYIVSGQGMGATLNIANEKNAYTISDRATYLAFSDKIQLQILVQKDAPLLNIYHVIRVNPQKWPNVNVAGAQAFADYLLSPEAQGLIGSFGVDKYHQALFVPDAGKNEQSLGGGQ
jgi:tungstate transport system substrate-binding protein